CRARKRYRRQLRRFHSARGESPTDGSVATVLPTFRLALLFSLPLALALLMLVDEGMLWPMLTLDVALVALAVTDALLSSRRLVSVRCEVPEVMSLGRKNPVTLLIRSDARRKLEVQV